MMLRFTIDLGQPDLTPGDLTIDAGSVVAIVELEVDRRKLAEITLWNSKTFLVSDPQREVAERISIARGGVPGQLERLP